MSDKNSTKRPARVGSDDVFASLRNGDFSAAIRVLNYIESVAIKSGPELAPTLNSIRNVEGLVKVMQETRRKVMKALRVARKANVAISQPEDKA